MEKEREKKKKKRGKDRDFVPFCENFSYNESIFLSIMYLVNVPNVRREREWRVHM